MSALRYGLRPFFSALAAFALAVSLGACNTNGGIPASPIGPGGGGAGSPTPVPTATPTATPTPTPSPTPTATPAIKSKRRTEPNR